MHWTAHLYISIVLLSGILMSILAAYAWRYRDTAGASAFAVFMGMSVLMGFITIMRFLDTEPDREVFWYNFRYLCLAVTPVVWMIFVAQYTGWQRRWNSSRLALLLGIPLLTQIIVWYHEVQGLLFGPGTSWWYGVHMMYSYLLIGLSIAILVFSMIKASSLQRRQLLWLLIGILLPVSMTLCCPLRLIPYRKMDMTLLLMTGTGLCFAWSLFRYQLFSLTPVARSAVVDSMQDPMFVLDRQQQIIDLNLAAEELIAHKKSYVLGQSAQQIFALWPNLLEALESAVEVRADFPLGQSEHICVYDGRISPFYDYKRRLSGQILVLHDITEHKQADEALRESQARLEASYQSEQERRKLSDTLREAVMIVSGTLDPSQVVSLLLDELQKVVTYHFASVMLVQDGHLTRLIRRNEKGDSYQAVTFPIDVYPLNAEVLQGKRPIVVTDVSQDARWKHSSETGKVRSLLNTPLLVQEQPVGVLTIGRSDQLAYTDEDASIVFTFAIHVAIAVENARLAEQTRTALLDLQYTLERLQRTQKRLIESEKLAALGKLVANVAHEINTPIGAIRASATTISSALQESLQYLPDMFRQFPPELGTTFFTFITRALQEKQLLTSAEERRLRRTLRKELETAGVSDADDVADTLVDMGIYNDLPPILPLLRHEKHRSLLRTAYNLTAQQHHSQNILNAADRAAKVVFALKTYAHIDISGQKSSANIAESIDVALTLYYNQLKHGIEVTRYYADVPQILCYSDGLTQVWANLIHNAIQSMQGKGTLEILVSRRPIFPKDGTSLSLRTAQHHPGYVVVEMTDSGPGIPNEIKERVFDPFFTTRPEGEGSGLGLDICKKIIEKHQGHIEVRSQPGETTFSVFLPIIPPITSLSNVSSG